MSAGPKEARTAEPRRILATVAVVALAAILMGTMVILALYTGGVSTRSEQQAAEINARLDALTESQKLIVAQLGAQTAATGTAAAASAPATPGQQAESVVPFTRSASETNLGVNVAIVRFEKPGATTQSGYPITIHYGNYLDGAAGYGVATSRGDVFQGTYYVDESTRTASAVLLRGAPVTVYGFGAAKPGAAAKIASAELARALARGDSVGQRWRDAWFWVKIGRQGEILAASETPPQ